MRRPADAYCFSPTEFENSRSAIRRADRKSPMSYSTSGQQWTFTEATGVLSMVAVPEPSTLVLLLAAAAAFGYYRRLTACVRARTLR
jgi:hypothetical protein